MKGRNSNKPMLHQAIFMQLVSQFCCDTSCRDGVTLSNSRVARPVKKIEQISTSRNVTATKKQRGMSVAGYVTVGKFSCNLCRNKIARQVARKIAQ